LRASLSFSTQCFWSFFFFPGFLPVHSRVQEKPVVGLGFQLGSLLWCLRFKTTTSCITICNPKGLGFLNFSVLCISDLLLSPLRPSVPHVRPLFFCLNWVRALFSRDVKQFYLSTLYPHWRKNTNPPQHSDDFFFFFFCIWVFLPVFQCPPFPPPF